MLVQSGCRDLLSAHTSCRLFLVSRFRVCHAEVASLLTLALVTLYVELYSSPGPVIWLYLLWISAVKLDQCMLGDVCCWPSGVACTAYHLHMMKYHELNMPIAHTRAAASPHLASRGVPVLSCCCPSAADMQLMNCSTPTVAPPVQHWISKE